MTLYEQYKKEIHNTSVTQITPGLSFAGCATCGGQDDCLCEYKNTLIKQSYLNAIDCMIEKISVPVLPEHKESELYKSLQEQRKLIEEHDN